MRQMKSPAALLLKLSPTIIVSIKNPYGQGRFDGMLSDKTTAEELVQIKAKVRKQVFNF
jgi:hypothetical protein